MQVQPYLFFDGRCEEAIEFYKSTLGIKVEMVMRFKDNPEPMPPGMCPPGSEHKVMHAAFRVGDTLVERGGGGPLRRLLDGYLDAEGVVAVQKIAPFLW